MDNSSSSAFTISIVDKDKPAQRRGTMFGKAAGEILERGVHAITADALSEKSKIIAIFAQPEWFLDDF